MKPKEWLFKNGHIDNIGRGRLSAAHKQAIVDAMTKDPSLRIEGFEATTSKSTSDGTPPTKEVKRVASDSNRILDCPEPLRDARDFRVVFKDTGKPIPQVGPKNVCDGCRNSFTYCPCPSPCIMVNNKTEYVAFTKVT